MKVIKGILALSALAILAVVLVGVISAGKSLNDADNTSARVSQHISEVSYGMSTDEVRAILGKPDSTQEMNSAGTELPAGPGGPITIPGESNVEWYYGTLSSKGTWQLSFTNGRLDSKNRY